MKQSRKVNLQILAFAILASVGALVGTVSGGISIKLVAVVTLILLGITTVMLTYSKTKKAIYILLYVIIFFVGEIVGSQQILSFWWYIGIIAVAAFGVFENIFGLTGHKKEE